MSVRVLWSRPIFFDIKKGVLIDSIESYVNISVDTFITFICEVGNLFQDVFFVQHCLTFK